MTTSTISPVTGPAAWRGDQLVDDKSWIYQLSDEQVAELEAAGRRFVLDDPDLRSVTREQYPLPACAEAVTAWNREMERGRGFVLIRGLHTELYSDAVSAAIFFLTGLHMGVVMQQSALGDVIDHVVATSSKTMDDPTARASRVRDKLVYHSDSSDAVALLCLRPAKEGGASSLVSGAQIFNEIVERRPDLAPLLLEPFHFDWRRQDPNSPTTTYQSPVVSIADGVFSMYAGTTYIFTAAQSYPDIVPPLTDDQVTVLRMFDEITQEQGMALDMDFQPGDIQWVSNYAALHSRTAFTDHPEPQRRRHLMRLWLRNEYPRPMVSPFGKPVKARDDQESLPDLGQFSIRTASIPRIDEHG
ncbi:TauD/TfdA family dioxygenase [Cryptosporangium sp. NPDC048952]|uniref:TauD/TfdA family dioxygenase n=1 Tax=Cryptosporangium sp. NPDC048952 TaxID=3363961 RepID=UPI00371046E8